MPSSNMLRGGVNVWLFAGAMIGVLRASTPPLPSRCLPAIHGTLCYATLLPPGWSLDDAGSRRSGIPAVFHLTGDGKPLRPKITLDALPHFPWYDVSKENPIDTAAIRQDHPDAQIAVLPLHGAQAARAIVISYSGVWQVQAVRDLGKIIAVAGLQCSNAEECAPYQPYFLRFLASLAFTPPRPNLHLATATGKTLGGGFVFGSDWMITFTDMPWLDDSDLANHFGVAEMFYPADWDPRVLTPFISLGLDTKPKALALEQAIAEAIADDTAEARKHSSDVTIQDGPLEWQGGHARTRTFTSKDSWDESVYSDGDTVIFLTTLHCQTKEQCQPYLPILRSFVPSLRYLPNVKVVDHTHPQ